MQTDSASTFNWSRWAFLGILVMTFASFVPLSILTPVPLVAAALLFGRKRGYLLGVVCIAFLSLIAMKVSALLLPAGVITLSLLYGTLISEVIFRKVHPVKGLILSGFTVVSLVALVIVAVMFSSDVSIPTEIEKVLTSSTQGLKIETESQKQLVENQIAHIKTLWVAISFISIFLWLWITLFVILRNSHLWRSKCDYPYYLSDLVRFKVPDFFVYPLILFLGLTLGGKYIGGEMGELVGINLLYCLGVFYFFHGVGVFLDLLTFLKLFRIMKMIILFFTVFLEPRIFFGIGVFDMWFNFRKFLKNKAK